MLLPRATRSRDRSAPRGRLPAELGRGLDRGGKTGSCSVERHSEPDQTGGDARPWPGVAVVTRACLLLPGVGHQIGRARRTLESLEVFTDHTLPPSVCKGKMDATLFLQASHAARNAQVEEKFR